MIVYLIPVAAVILALLWNRWARRPDKPLDPMSQVEAYQRAVRAMSRERHGRGVAPRRNTDGERPTADAGRPARPGE